MSKVISFSISDRYLDKLRSLYPSLTDNLAVKQFVTDRLSSSLDGSLDDSLDGKLKSLIESELDGILDERLDSVMGKLITSLSERMARLEERLDDGLDGSLDDMERLLRLQREASIAAPIPTSETSHDEPVTDAIEAVTPEVSPSPPDAIAGRSSNGMTSAEAYRFLISKNVKIAPRSLDNWIRDSKISKSRQGKEAQEYIYIKDKKYYAIE